MLPRPSSEGESGQNRGLNLSRLCFKLLKGSCEVQIHVEVVTRGKRGRERIATIERDANVAGIDGIGLTLDEVKSLTARLQSIVGAEQVQEVV